MYQGKSYIIVKRNVKALFRNKQKYIYNLYKLYVSYAMRLMSKIEYLIVPKGTKFTELGKLGLRQWQKNNVNLQVNLFWE